MKEHPILFSTPMVQAILEGRKTQTRRIMKPQPTEDDLRRIEDWSAEILPACPYGRPGDLLWVRETFSKYNLCTYKADDESAFIGCHQWKPSIHMPKDFARIWLRLSFVGVEPIQAISEADAIAEGIEPVLFLDRRLYKNYLPNESEVVNSPIHSYLSLWQSINGFESWAFNPMVWVLEFEVLSTTGKPKEDFDDVDDDSFQPCRFCDGHDACADFGCAMTLGIRPKITDENISEFL